MPQKTPLPEEVKTLIRAQRALGRFSRRSMLAGAGALGAGTFLSACGTSTKSSSAGKPSTAEDHSLQEHKVNWANWPAYLDFDENTKRHPTLIDFEGKTGIKPVYAEDINDNNEYYGKIQEQLRMGKDIGRDIFTITDWMAARMIRQGLVQRFDHNVMPNLKNLRADLQNVDYDPGRNFSVTWQSGFTGLAYNTAKMQELGVTIKNVDDLWNPKLKNRVMVLSEMRDTLGLIMAQQGVDVKKFTEAQFGNALDELERRISDGYIRQVAGNDYMEALKSGDALAAFAWSGDVAQLNAEGRGKWTFLLPEAGGLLWSDNLMVPVGARHKQNAEILMNYYYQPDVAAKVAQYVQYVCPVVGAKQAMSRLDPSLGNNQMIFPDEKTLAKAPVIRTLTTQEETTFNDEFQRALGV
jgi:spermidine/putrescine transport system substrate-binding protein